MAKLKLSLSIGDYDVNRGLLDGSVQAEGIDLVVLSLPAPERHRRMMQDLEFDACELSLSSFLSLKDQDLLPVQAIPAFPLRKMRHSSVFIHVGKGINKPSDLNGKRIGLRSYQVTAGLWARGILQDEYGVDLKSIRWVAGDRDDIPFDPPDWLQLEQLPPGTDVDRMLVEGELDACIYPEILPSIARRDPRVARLWKDAKQEEINYYRRTGLIPIMHCVVVKESLLEEHPWVAINLLKAFRDSKEQHMRRYQHDTLFLSSLCWARDAWEEQEQLMGPDPFPYDFQSARHAIDTACRYAYEQGLTKKRLQPEELFFKPSLKEIPHYVQ